MTKTAKERIEEEIKEAELSYKMNDRRSGDYIAGTLKGLKTALEHVENAGQSQHSKLSIPKKIAEIADETWGYGDIDPIDIFGDVRLPDFERWWKSQEHPKDLIVAYLAGGALGVELVEVTDE